MTLNRIVFPSDNPLKFLKTSFSGFITLILISDNLPFQEHHYSSIWPKPSQSWKVDNNHNHPPPNLSNSSSSNLQKDRKRRVVENKKGCGMKLLFKNIWDIQGDLGTTFPDLSELKRIYHLMYFDLLLISQVCQAKEMQSHLFVTFVKDEKGSCKNIDNS